MTKKMKPDEIMKKFKELENRIDKLATVNNFFLKWYSANRDEPMVIAREFPFYSMTSHSHYIMYLYRGEIKEILTNKHVDGASMVAYCDTHFILKDLCDEYLLVDMAAATLTKVPKEFIFSKDCALMFKDQALKVMQPRRVGVICTNGD